MCRLAKQKSNRGKFVEFISRAKDYIREIYKSQNINPISPTKTYALDAQNNFFSEAYVLRTAKHVLNSENNLVLKSLSKPRCQNVQDT